MPRPTFGGRQLFPNLSFRAFLGHAAISPASRATVEAATDCLADLAARGAGAFPVWDLQRKRLRESLAALIGARAEQIALTPGTTRGITDLALGLPWKSGDVLVTFEGEFPANVTPWQRASLGFGFETRFLAAPDLRATDPQTRILEQLERELGRGATHVAVSAVQFQTGFRMPLREMGRLCRLHGALFLVDAIQACGSLPLDVEELAIDGLACGAHKWLLGIEGAGFLYVRPELQATLRPLTAGWVSHEDAEGFLFRGAGELRYDRALKGSAQVFEGSSQNAVGFAALEAGVDICQSLGPAKVFEHVQVYHDAIEPIWVARGFRSLRASAREQRSCLLCFELPEGVPLPGLALELRSRGVMVSTPDGNLRLAPHFANHLGEVEVVEQALDEALTELRR